jgi:RNA polymerase sigma-70 factor (ECF subfamily)
VLRPRLLRFALSLARNRDEAEDLVQATYARAIERFDQYRLGSRLIGWLFSILNSIWVNQVRSADVRRRHADYARLAAVESDHPWPGLEARQSLAKVRQRVAELPEDQRAALMLIAVEGLSYREASDILNVPMGTLASRLARARYTLRAALDPEGRDP